MDAGIGRRAFLKALAAGTVTLAGLRTAVASSRPTVGSSRPTVRPTGRFRAPGDVVEVEWPAGLDPARARLVHRIDGRPVASGSIPAPEPGVRPVVRLVAEPAGGLRPGRHDFVLEAGGSSEDLGGFEVTPYAFGC